MKMSKCKIAIFDFLHFLMIMVHYRHENEADGQAAVPAEVQAPLGDIVAPGAASPADLLAPHGQFWTSQPDGELVIVDPTANVQWGPAPRINWGNAHAEPVTCRPLDFFFTLLPMGFLREVLVPATNANLQEMTAAVTTAGELLRFHGLILAIALDSVHGGTDTYWDATNPSSTCVLGRDFRTCLVTDLRN